MSQQPNRPTARFPLGDIVATPGAIEALQEAKQESLALLRRHQTGGWGSAPFDGIGNCDKVAIR
jgi:hypothetical protein